MKSREERREQAWENLEEMVDIKIGAMIADMMDTEEAEFLILDLKDMKELIHRVWVMSYFGGKK